MATQSVTLASKNIHPLLGQEQQGLNCNWRARFDVRDFTLTATEATDDVKIKIFDTPTIWAIDRCFLRTVEAFTVTGGVDAIFGTNGDPNNFIANIDVAAIGTYGIAGYNIATFAGSIAEASDVLELDLINDTSGGPDEWVTGIIDVYFNMIDFGVATPQ